MSESVTATAAVWSYALALAGYLAFAVRVALGWRLSVRASLLLGAMAATAIWAGGGLAVALQESRAAWLTVKASDALRYGIWFAFVWSLLEGARRRDAPSASPVFPKWAGALTVAGLVASVVLSEELPLARLLALDDRRVEFGIRIGLAVCGLMLVEQLVRRAHAQSRWAIKPLSIALAGVFGFDLFCYADAMLFSRIDVYIWMARGVANALVIPLIAVATARNTGWNVEMHLSREAVFRSTALFVSGAFLLAVAAAGYLVRYLVGDWGRALQIELVFAALLSVGVIASSGRFRSRLKVFVGKHFFSFRYDYRVEWLRFSRTLSGEGSIHGIQVRVIMALADLVESPAGALWLKAEGRGGFVPEARWNTPATDAAEPENSSLALFLGRTGWIVNVKEFAAAPEKYRDLTLPAWLAGIPNAWLIVPLMSGTELIGFVVLATSRAAVKVDWEVRDLLKTASRQAASYLGQLRATEALLEARKFDAFNRMSAFIVHDLKNLVAQLSLLLRNAARHSGNPEFHKDMLATVQNVVERMNGLMLQLRSSSNPVENARPVELEPLVRRVCAAKIGQRESVALDAVPGLVALGNEERFEHVIGHLVQNALDATADGGRVSVRLDRNDRFAVIDVSDTGVGMTPEFVRERLFKPFETTKKTGMGIGVYESWQYITGLGGEMQVDSTPQVGTLVRVLVPLGGDTAASSAAVKEVA